MDNLLDKLRDAATTGNVLYAESIKEIERLTNELNDLICKAHDFECGVASALGWSSEGKPFVDHIREIREERNRYKRALEIARQMGNNANWHIRSDVRGPVLAVIETALDLEKPLMTMIKGKWVEVEVTE
jgi:hypothetical protein